MEGHSPHLMKGINKKGETKIARRDESQNALSSDWEAGKTPHYFHSPVAWLHPVSWGDKGNRRHSSWTDNVKTACDCTFRGPLGSKCCEHMSPVLPCSCQLLAHFIGWPRCTPFLFLSQKPGRLQERKNELLAPLQCLIVKPFPQMCSHLESFWKGLSFF